ncbi:unnamed protein product [Rhizophagus irregularis]|uniref:Leucine Rich Repeat domain protein n=1 Tax=Rhizophagus irregularis TaxID=588596 RepID=A0A2N1N9N5_9GLOM|nr:Leucine Rich Repeat domain protein [Rhizophagus irregularis]CAB4392476.1 unnamed protein product [Rhizophagus irregularis]CAB5345983.1 unnamed protein product [Rhizophagus irregularis]
MPGVVLPAHQYHLPLIKQQLVSKNQNKNSNENIPYIPPEIIRIILNLLKDDKKTLAACALVNHTFNLHVTPILYHSVSFSFSYPFTFISFANTIIDESQRSQLIRHLDLSSFSIIGLQKSKKSMATIENVATPNLIIQILRYCTMLESFSVSESLESAITFEVLQVLAFECKNIKTLDFCGLASKQFNSALTSLTEVMGYVKIFWYYENGIPTYSFQKVNYEALPHLKRLSLHECPIISETSIITLLAHSPNLTHLDLGGCSISDLTLNFLANETNIPQTLTHLLLAKCKNISSENIAALVAECKRLEVLNLYGDRDYATAINEYDLITILTSPSAKKFKNLDIGSSHITPNVLHTIQENCSALRHLGISKARIQSITYLVNFLKAIPNLEYIDLTGVQCMTPLNVASLINNLQKDHSLHIIEMSESLVNKLGSIDKWKTNKNYSRRWYFSKQTYRPDRVHSRKLDMAEYGPEGMSKIFQYYSFDR